jgi:BirA family biotin operon repressor/biotin-[acetyl-CoA-carboxylase] ligase
MNNDLISPYTVVYLDEVDSTNDEVRRRVELGARSGLWVVAGCQTRGRGRRGREWASARGNFFGSFFIELDSDPKIWSELSFVAALAVRTTIEAVTQGAGEVGLKWPNDVLYNGKKISGLLLESGSGSILGGVIIGVGINLASSPQDTPYETTSIFNESGIEVLASDFLPMLVASFDYYFNIWKAQGFTAIKDLWMEHVTGLNKPALVQLSNESFKGIFLGLSDNGGGRIHLDDGTERIVLAGDIFPLA